MLKKGSNKISKSTHYTGLLFNKMKILSDEIDIDKSGIPFYTQESTDSFDPKDSVQLTQMLVTTNQDNDQLITFDSPSLANKEVLHNTLIYIMMFTP